MLAKEATPVDPRFIIFMCIYKRLLNYEYFCKKLKPSRPVRRTCFPMIFKRITITTNLLLAFSTNLCTVLHIFAYDIPESLIPNMQNKIKLIK